VGRLLSRADCISLLRSRIVLLVIRAFSLVIDLRRRSRSIDTAYREIFCIGRWRLLERSIHTSLVRIPCVQLARLSVTKLMVVIVSVQVDNTRIDQLIRLFYITVFVS